MSSLDRDLLAERVMMVERHLARVADRLPAEPAALLPVTDASDAVILHLWQAVQIVIDLALATCLHLKLGTPTSYADAFDDDLAARLVCAAGFRNVVAHAYERLDMARVFRAARDGPPDLRRFLAVLRDRV